MDELRAIFGPEGQELIASSDEATARRNREVFTVAVAEGWRLLDQGTNRKTLIVGNEAWPFPVPAREEREQVAIRHRRGKRRSARAPDRPQRAGGDRDLPHLCRGTAPLRATGTRWKARGPLCDDASAAIRASRTDCIGRPSRGQPRSPLGDLVAQASAEGRPLGTDREQPSPFHGYYFKILTAQGAAAPGGAKSYIVNGEMSAGFALVAWPAQYDATGIMTFAVNQDGVVHETDLGAETDATAAAMTTYNPDASWRQVQ